MTHTTKQQHITKWLGAGVLSLGLLAGSLGFAAHPAAAEADMNVSFTNPAATIGVGEELTYTLRVRNQGTNGTAEVALNLSASGGATILGVSQPGADRFENGCQVTSDTAARCTGGFFGPNVEGQVALRVRAPQTPGEIRLRARVNRGTDDRNPLDGFAQAETTVIIRPDLRVTDIDGPSAVGDAASGSYVVTVRNSGGSLASNVRLVVRSENLPLDFFQVDVLDEGSNFNCALTETLSFQTPRVTCTGGSLSAGESARVRIRARTSNVIGSGSGVIRATIDPNNAIQESNEGNNSRTHAVSYNGGIF